MTTIRNLFYVVLGAVLAIFIYFNFDQRVVIYLTRTWHTQEVPLSLALFGALLVGFVVAALLAIADQLRLRSLLRQMRKSVDRLESELAELRQRPLDESLPSRSLSEPENDSESGL